MAAKKKAKAMALSCPCSREEAEEMLGELGRLQRQIGDLELRMNNRLARFKERYEALARPHREAAELRFEALRVWAEANKAQLLDGRSKTVRLGTGELSWRTNPPAVRITGVEAVIQRLIALGLDRFLRRKTDVNREAILAEPEAVASVEGIAITRGEEFVAKPFESEIARATEKAPAPGSTT